MALNYKGLKPTERFTNRAENYVRYRPSYPEALFAFFENELKVNKEMSMADIGSGTGLFAEHFLEKGYKVICVEPNTEMRKAGEKKLNEYTGFISSDKSAEDTGIESQSIDIVVAAQAFHWMEPIATKKEFSRIVKPNGKIVILWILLCKDTPFLEGYEKIRQQFGIDYKAVDRANESVIAEFYKPMKMSVTRFTHTQLLDFDSLKGHLISASFIPLSDHPTFETMIQTLKKLFDDNQKEGKVEMKYETIVFWNNNENNE